MRKMGGNLPVLVKEIRDFGCARLLARFRAWADMDEYPPAGPHWPALAECAPILDPEKIARSRAPALAGYAVEEGNGTASHDKHQPRSWFWYERELQRRDAPGEIGAA